MDNRNQDANPLNPSASKPRLSYKSILWNLLLFLERWSRRFLFFVTLVVIGYMVYITLQGVLSTNADNYFSSPELVPLRRWVLNFYFAHRQFLFILWFVLLLPLGLPTIIIHATKKETSKSIRLVLKWFGLLVLIILAYAVAGLLTDLVMVAIFFNRNLLQAKGVPLTPPFPTPTSP